MFERIHFLFASFLADFQFTPSKSRYFDFVHCSSLGICWRSEIYSSVSLFDVISCNTIGQFVDIVFTTRQKLLKVTQQRKKRWFSIMHQNQCRKCSKQARQENETNVENKKTFSIEFWDFFLVLPFNRPEPKWKFSNDA